MKISRENTLTIGRLMMMIAAVAVAIGVVANPGTTRSISLVAGFLGVAFMATVLCIVVFDLATGLQCPRCGARAMTRASVMSFSDRFYRCTACQARYLRGLFRGWDDASSPEFDPIYARKRPENPWTAPPSLDDEDLVYSKTHVNLLLNKQRRNPNPPDQTISPPPK